jgi:hypothetical protein
MAESVPGVITFLAEPLVSTYGPPLLVVTMGIFVKFLLARLHFVERAFYSGLDLIWASLGITLAKLTAIAQSFTKLAKPTEQVPQLSGVEQAVLFSLPIYILIWFAFLMLIVGLHNEYEKTDDDLARLLMKDFDTLSNKAPLLGKARGRRIFMLCVVANFFGILSLYLYDKLIGV